MWFRNLQIYRLPAGWDVAPAQLETSLSKRPLQPCGNQDMESRGWVSPRGNDALLHMVGRQWLLALGAESRLLPSSVVRQEAEARAEALAEKQGYRLGRKQMRELSEQVTQELLPRAFIRQRRAFLWIDPTNGWLGVDAPSAARAEEALECLRETLDDFPLALLRPARSPASAMADWLASDPPSGFTVDRDCELRSVSEEKSTVRYAHHPLDGGEIRDHLAAGKLPTRLALTWNDRVSFVLTDKLELKRLDFLDVVRESLGNEDDADALFDAELALMTAELSHLLPALVEALGGELA
ncbi:MAG: recombination-associated protein RdgC [Azoarcus sp.]|jgi:recombination associated protein RdgC|nr:recombination-associated protein RdgC [Azoarcus sp.]